jgi:hypothetical protein
MLFTLFYQPTYNKWSTCSVEDLSAFYSANQPFCMAADSSPLPTIIPTTTTTSSDPCVSYKV